MGNFPSDPVGVFSHDHTHTHGEQVAEEEEPLFLTRSADDDPPAGRRWRRGGSVAPDDGANRELRQNSSLEVKEEA